MPTSVETTKEIQIEDKIIEMRPLKIIRLRKFMKEFEPMQSGELATEDESLDVLMRCCVIAMEQYEKKYANQEKLEELLDINDVYLIVEAATGIKLGGDGGN